MSRALHVSADWSLPLKFLSLRKVVFGGSGSGKTASGRVLFEEATDAGVLCGAIDLKGDWWGLKSTADGQGDGIPVVIFGGDHQDVPLDENGGASLAEIVVELRQPFVVDLEQLSKGKQLRFLGAFFDRLYDRNREPLVLFCDEADRYAAQKPMSPEANVCLGATEDIAKRGRKHGIFPVFITQRNASLNKGVSELCDVAMVFRTPGPRDQEAVEDWFGTKATREQRDEVMAKLAGLPTGTAVISCAHPDLKVFKTVPIRMPRTFDSSATPEIGKRSIEPKRLAKPDLEKLQQRMAVTIEKAKAEDPRELRRRIAELQKQVADAQRSVVAAPRPTKERRVEVPVLKDAQIKRLEYLTGRVEAILKHFDSWEKAFQTRGEDLRAATAEIATTVRVKLPPVPAATGPVERFRFTTGTVGYRDSASSAGWEISEVAGQAVVYRPRAATGKGTDRTAPVAQRILDALAELEQLGSRQPQRELVAFLAGYAHLNSKGFTNAIGTLRSGDLIAYPIGGTVSLTPEGRAQAQPPARPRTAEELRERVIGMLGGASGRILAPLIAAYPRALPREVVVEKAGYGHSNSKGFTNAIGRLRTLGFIDYPDRGSIVAASVLFLEG